MYTIRIIKRISNQSRGFTLVELIVTVGILSILALAGLTAVNPIAQFQKANDARRKADFSQIQKALETYYQDNGKYPSSSITNPLYRITIPSQLGTTTVDWGTSWQPYMNLLPKDPSGSKYYVYYSTGQSYYLYASLDRGSGDPQSCQNLNANGECLNVPAANLCGTGVKCNFGVTSPNVSP
ncbi:MAG: prepilin-type N-terminal cleavage/methylation domain-containing protein [Patescibacteria group bacterium]|nr:prepilin-type N-terminal cleavage/methylation domain-containing protein [Patescibacteria group bacterium]